MVAAGWIEQIFHMAPDGGSGFTENLITVCVAVGGLLYAGRRVVLWRKARQKP